MNIKDYKEVSSKDWRNDCHSDTIMLIRQFYNKGMMEKEVKYYIKELK